MREQKRHNANAPGHVHYAGNNRCPHVNAKLLVYLVQRMAGSIGTSQFDSGFGIDRPLHTVLRHRLLHQGAAHCCGASLLVRAHSACLRDWRRTSGVMRAFHSMYSGAPANAIRSMTGSSPSMAASKT